MKQVIVGSGIAGVTLAEELKKTSPQDEITLVTSDNIGYYARPLLSHGFSSPDIKKRILLKDYEKIKELGIDVESNYLVTAINSNEQIISGPKEIYYDRLFLATGSAAFIPPLYDKYINNFSVLNTLQDLQTLWHLRETIIKQGQQPRWAIIGGGIIGCELASDVHKAGDRVSIFHLADRLIENVFDPEQSLKLKSHFENLGITVTLKESITAIDKQANDLFSLSSTLNLYADFDIVVLAVGFKPRTELAKKAGLTINKGIVVNEFLQTQNPNIFALGDGAEINGKTYAFIPPVRSQALWLAKYVSNKTQEPWRAPDYKVMIKIHGFNK